MSESAAQVGCPPAKPQALNELSYKELQNMCMGFNLPANLKHSQMLRMLEARNAGDEATIHAILTEYREQRCKRRPKSTLPPGSRPEQTEQKTKRRRLSTANRHQDYCYVFPQQTASGQFWTSELPPESRHQSDDSAQLRAVDTSGLETMKLVMEATATRREVSAPELTVHRPQPLLRTLLQEGPGPSATETIVGAESPAPQSFYGGHATWPVYLDMQRADPPTYIPDATTTPHIFRPVLFDPGMDSTRLLDLNQPCSYSVPLEQAEDLSIGRHPPVIPPCHLEPPQTFPAFYPERVNPQSLRYSHSPKSTAAVTQPDHGTKCSRRGDNPPPLELVLNVKSDYHASEAPMPTFWKSATTTTHQCYRSPVCSATAISAPREMAENAVGQEEVPGAAEEPWWGAGNDGAHQVQRTAASFPEFRQNDQLSYPLIYSYLASTDEELQQETEGRRGLGWPLEAQHRPQAMSSPNDATSHVVDGGTSLFPAVSEDPQLRDAMFEIIQDEHRSRQPPVAQCCRYQRHGCRTAGLEPSDLQQHEKVCTYQTVQCYNQCAWSGRLKHLSAHLREVHRKEISRRAEASHTIPLHEVRALQKMSFLREVKRRLFVITIHCHGHLLYATIQFVPSWKPDSVSLVKASLEVVGQDGRPHSWRGKVRPVYESLSTLWATDQCLTVDPAAIGAFAGANIILHTKITAYGPGST
ncbi:uncharacterized protein LOC110827771 isoform X2 [Zootermopsis nevadensis]|uniref:uncharacterized protein LOC110827771 isoform X2 n=1 Tax=Zootermopsis nevadensis TaxID=136037 RepID=UPI000B8EE3F0|nr:uncharacterized protein LOC110827771 isoform X2 [Zootermopsis nevadensis]